MAWKFFTSAGQEKQAYLYATAELDYVERTTERHNYSYVSGNGRRRAQPAMP